LTALRAGRWFDHYGRPAEFGVMMDRWCEALQADANFRQQLDPLNGQFTGEGATMYSPAALVMLDYTWRLAGVREEGETLEWNGRPGHPATQSAVFRMQAAEMKYDREGAELRLGGKALGRIESGAARLVTDRRGFPRVIVGISEQTQNVVIRLAGSATQKVALRPNTRLAL
jgi:hypothetical protein